MHSQSIDYKIYSDYFQFFRPLPQRSVLHVLSLSNTTWQRSSFIKNVWNIFTSLKVCSKVMRLLNLNKSKLSMQNTHFTPFYYYSTHSSSLSEPFTYAFVVSHTSMTHISDAEALSNAMSHTYQNSWQLKGKHPLTTHDVSTREEEEDGDRGRRTLFFSIGWKVYNFKRKYPSPFSFKPKSTAASYGRKLSDSLEPVTRDTTRRPVTLVVHIFPTQTQNGQRQLSSRICKNFLAQRHVLNQRLNIEG